MRKALTLAALTALTIAGAAAAAPAPWVGHYVFEEEVGPNLSKTIVQFITHELTLTPTDCRIKAQGLQTDEVIRCTVQPHGSGLELRFKSYGDGKTVNKYGTRIYEVGEPLLTLSKPNGKLVTRFQSYSVVDKFKSAGPWFKKG